MIAALVDKHITVVKLIVDVAAAKEARPAMAKVCWAGNEGWWEEDGRRRV